LKKIREYQEHAAECREMARTAQSSHRQQLLAMADAWDGLAEARQRQLTKAGLTEAQDDGQDLGK
jgi:hypothetical protein